jgi:hypothetical protein
MWTVATYASSGLFTLRPSNTTNSGGQTLLFPTPYALKMALLDVAIRGWGVTQGASWFETIRDLRVALVGPSALVVNNTFIKIWRPKKDGPDDRDGTGLETPLNSTIAFRAFVAYNEPFQLAFGLPTAPPPTGTASSSSEQELLAVSGGGGSGKTRKGGRGVSSVSQEAAVPLPLAALMAQLSYIGKRGSFIQLLDTPREAEALDFYPDGNFVELTGKGTASNGSGDGGDEADDAEGEGEEDGEEADAVVSAFPLYGTLQPLDDCASHLTFAQVNVYDPTRINPRKDRVVRHVVLPYNLERSNRSYQLYRRLE